MLRIKMMSSQGEKERRAPGGRREEVRWRTNEDDDVVDLVAVEPEHFEVRQLRQSEVAAELVAIEDEALEESEVHQLGEITALDIKEERAGDEGCTLLCLSELSCADECLLFPLLSRLPDFIEIKPFT